MASGLSHNFWEIFLNSKAVLANPDSRDKKMQDLARLKLDIAICSGSSCCPVKDNSLHLRIDFRYSMHIETSIGKPCFSWMLEKFEPLVQLEKGTNWWSLQPGIKDAIKPALELGMFAVKRVKLEQLDQLFYGPCRSILMAIPIVESGRELVTFTDSINSALPQITRNFGTAWKWCYDSMNEIESMRKRYSP